MKIKFQLGSDTKRSFKFNTSSIPKGEGRNFAEDVLKIVADAAQAIKDRIDDYEQAHAGPTDLDPETKSGPKKSGTETKSGAEATTDPQPEPEPQHEPMTAGGPSSPCAETLGSLDLGERQIRWLELDDSSAALISLLEGEDQLDLWRRVQHAVNPSGCYAVLVDGDTADYLDDDLRIVPDTGADERFSSLRADVYAKHEPLPMPDPLFGSHYHNATEHRFGSSPSASELAAAQLTTTAELDEFLSRWERETFGDDAVIANANPEAIFWYETDDAYLLVLPVPDGASVVRALGFWPTIDRPKWLQALGNDLKAWERDFGAALVANYGTMLQFVVSRPPTDLDTAYQLAAEHDIVGGSTLGPSGVQRRHYAADLINQTRWHLHDRP